MKPSNLKRQYHHLVKEPAKRKTKHFTGHSQESSDSRERPVDESLEAQNQAVLLAQRSPLVKECKVIVEKLSLEDIERIGNNIKPTRLNNESVPQYVTKQTCTIHSNENLDASDGANPQDLGSCKDPGTSSLALPNDITISNNCNKIELDLDEEEALFLYSFSSSSEDSDEELSEAIKKTQSSPDYNLLGENKKAVDTPASEVIDGTSVPKESFSRDKTINDNSNKNESNDLTHKTQGPLHVNGPSVLCLSTKDADVSDKFLKSSQPPMESFSNRNPFSDTNKDTTPKTTLKGPKPKLTKYTLLRKPIVCKSIKKNPMIKQTHANNLERSVDCSRTKQGITRIKITKLFSYAGINNDQRTKESCAVKENLKHMSMLKPCDTSPTLHKDTEDKDYTEKNIKQRKPIVCKSIKKNPMIKQTHDNNLERLVDCSGTNQGVTRIKITKLFSYAGINNDQGTKESCAAKENLQHMSMLKPCDTSTFHEDTEDEDNKEKNIKPDFSFKPLVKRKIKDVDYESDEVQNGSVKKLNHSEDNNIDDMPISVEQLSRNISLGNNNGLKRSIKRNAPSSSMNHGLNQTVVPLNDFSFVKPKELPKQRVMETPSNYDDDDDDDESVLSFFAPDDLISDIENDEEELKRTWNKFEREKLDCLDNDEQANELTDEGESTHQISSRQFTQKKYNSAVDHSNKNEINGERGDTHSHDSSRVEQFKLWNQTSENVTANDINTKSYPQSIIKDYCLLYLRLSVESHHGCNLIHQVPCHLFSAEGIQDEKKIVGTINYIIKTNFRNPPQEFVSAIVSYCVQCNQRDLERRISILVDLGNALKGVKIDKAEQLWCTFLKAIAQYLILPNSKKSMHISRVLQGIFGNQLDFRSEDCEVFKLAQKALIEVNRIFKSHIQLLMCIGFMCEKTSKSRLDVRLISPEFALSVVKQCLDEINNLPLSVWKKFAYKVVVNLISDHHFSYVVDLCNHDKHLVSQFFKMVESMKVTESARFSRIKKLISNEIENPSLEQRSGSESQPPTNLHLTTNLIAPGSNLLTISTYLENSYDKGELNVKEVYSHFKYPDRRKTFISCLSLLKVDVKEHLSDVIMSFLSDEASNGNWDICYELFECLPNWDFKTIKNLKGNRTPTSNLLTVILVLLKNKKTTEALNLFFQYKLFKHEGDWFLNYIKEDLVKHKYIICSIFSEQIKSLGNNRFFTTMRLISEQDTLDAPINLAGNVVSLLSELIQKGHHKDIVQLVTRILDERKDEPLVLPSDMYRTIVVILCQENKLKHALLVFLKAMKNVSVYPCIPIRRDSVSTGNEMSVEIDCSLTGEEMKVIVYTILIGFGDVIKNSGFSLKFKEFIDDDPQRYHLRDDIFKSYILVEDTSVRNSIQRFRRAVIELIPNARFKTRGRDCIEIEKISLKEYCDQQSKRNSVSE